MNQKDGTHQVVSAVLKESGTPIDPKTPVTLSPEERAKCIERLSTMFSQKQISCTQSYEPKRLKTYCGGLLSNWLKKDRRLNGDVEFQLQNPGSRADNSSPEIVEMRKLKKQVKGTDNEAKVQKILDEMVTNHRQAKKKQDINLDLIPAELQDLVG